MAKWVFWKAASQFYAFVKETSEIFLFSMKLPDFYYTVVLDEFHLEASSILLQDTDLQSLCKWKEPTQILTWTFPLRVSVSSM